MKPKARLRFVVLALALAGALPLVPAQDENLLKIDTAVLPRRLSRGERGRVVLRLGVPEGIRLLARASFVIEFGAQEDLVFPKDFFAAADLNMESVESEGETWLTLRKPVEIPFTASPRAARGSHILEGRIKFLARSRKDGWCLKSSAKFSIPFSVR